MNPRIFVYLFFICSCYVNAQIPNGGFEEWETIDTIENPVAWSTNNYYVGFSPVKKTDVAIAGEYSMKISSTARDLNGQPTWPGCAHVKFLPIQTYQYMIAAIRIDSINEGKIEIRVKQRKSNGFFEKIGGWERSTITNGVVNIWFPLEQMQMDTLLVEIWAFNKDTPEWEVNETYAEAILDNLSLTNTVAVNAKIEGNAGWTLSPIPANGNLSVILANQIHGPIRINMFDFQGNLVKSFDFFNLKIADLNVASILSGIYILTLEVNGVIQQLSKVVVEN